jgi:hypothetical protein
MTKTQMFQLADEHGLGEGRALPASFVEFQQQGLLGQANGRTSRRGGEGLWHDRQASLWLDLLIGRAHGVRTVRLLNLPVYLWLISEPGVELAQAQRAWFNFASGYDREGHDAAKGVNDRRSQRRPPTGTRSERQRVRNKQADLLGGNDRSLTARRKYREMWEMVDDSYLSPPSKETLFEASRSLWPDADEAELDRYTESEHFRIECRGLAVRHRHYLTSRAERIDEFWDWSRALTVEVWRQARLVAPTLDTDSIASRLLHANNSPTAFMASACNQLIDSLGYGLGYQNRKWKGDALSLGPEPPNLPTFRPDEPA